VITEYTRKSQRDEMQGTQKWKPKVERKKELILTILDYQKDREDRKI
jgi:hypothetical protein